tara:strand:+ start:2807 stop:3703 length:897 start_codon:yes stop_codon:yes gene_type:complete
METNEKILVIIKEKGPLLPVQVSKEINDNILMTSARLSELLTTKQIKISSLKVGGSPLYYFSGQENKLQNFVDNLAGMEKKAYNLLEQKKVLKDSTQEPAIRVALRQIKDFAVPLQVNYQNKSEIFWKWYLFDNKEAEPLIKNLLTEISKEEVISQQKENIVTEKAPFLPKEETKTEAQQELKKDTTKKIKRTIDKGMFLKNIQDFFSKRRINIIEEYDVKKNTEMEFVIRLETTIGNIKYFCKTKNKKKINDADLSSAVIQAQSKNLPLLFLTNGTLTKKAQEMLNNEFKNITFRNI